MIKKKKQLQECQTKKKILHTKKLLSSSILKSLDTLLVALQFQENYFVMQVGLK